MNTQIFSAVARNDVLFVREHPDLYTARDVSRNTPLHLAAKFGYLEIIKTIVQTDGFDVKDYVNDQGMDPFLVAVIF